MENLRKLIREIITQTLSEKKKKRDRCLRIADRKFDKPSAYKSGAVVRCRQGKIWKGLKENTTEENIQYSKPNFEFEWEEAIRYPEFVEIGKDSWVKLGNQGYTVNYSDIEDRLGNVDLDFDSLDINKQARFKKAFRSGIIEYPIVVKFSDNDYDLVAGNTRLAGLIEFDIDPKIWVVDLTQLNEAKKESLYKWFKRQGPSGKEGGWVDCNTCRKVDGKTKCKACGRKKGEKRAKYPSCRPTPSQCKQKGKGKKWGKTK